MASKAAQATAAKLSGDEKTGANIIAAALRAPICQIAANAGVEGAVILDKVSKSKSVNYGYDAAHDTFGDMIENGIVDPTKVCRSALENAASVSSMVLTTESLVADLPEKAAPAAPGRPGHGRYVLIPPAPAKQQTKQDPAPAMRAPDLLLSAFFSIHGAAGSPAHAPDLRRKCPPRSLRITSSSRLIMSFGIYSVSAAQMDGRY